MALKRLTDKERYEVFFLNVDIKEIEEVKELGAKWDKGYKKWYVPNDLDKSLFAEWFGTTKGFNLSKSSLENPLLYVDLVPQTTWYSNLCKALKRNDWDKIRNYVYNKNNNVCEMCGCFGKDGRVDAHERWEYDDENHIQKLVGVSCLCPKCHRSTHIGFANVIGLGDAARANLQWINRWTDKEVKKHIEQAYQKWAERSDFDWVVDISWLKSSGIEVSEKSLKLFKIEGDTWILPKKVK